MNFIADCIDVSYPSSMRTEMIYYFLCLLLQSQPKSQTWQRQICKLEQDEISHIIQHSYFIFESLIMLLLRTKDLSDMSI